jgi:hypothetical protein
MAYRYLSAVIAAVVLTVSIALAGQVTSKKQMIINAIEKVRTGESPMARQNAGYALYQSTIDLDPKEIDDETLNDMVSLLDIPEAKSWVASALGNLKSRAKVAIPKLLKMIAEEDCNGRRDIISAQAFRLALIKIGVEVPGGVLPSTPPKCEDEKAKDSKPEIK